MEHKGWKVMVLQRLGQIVVPPLLLCIAFNFRQAHLRRYRYGSIDTCTYCVLKVRSGNIDNVRLIYAHIAASAHVRCWLDISITGEVVTPSSTLPTPTSIALQMSTNGSTTAPEMRPEVIIL
jgi:hypothetical protein